MDLENFMIFRANNFWYHTHIYCTVSNNILYGIHPKLLDRVDLSKSTMAHTWNEQRPWLAIVCQGGIAFFIIVFKIMCVIYWYPITNISYSPKSISYWIYFSCVCNIYFFQFFFGLLRSKTTCISLETK